MRTDIDKSNMFENISRFSEQASEAWNLGKNLKFEFKQMVIAGMGGSAISGDLLECYVSEIPIIVNRDYKLPDHVDKNCLVVVNSYSGNTEETISAYVDAMTKKAQILVLTSGGKIMQMANENGHPVIEIPSGMQPRASLMYSFMPLLRVLQNSGVINDITNQVNETQQILKDEDIRTQAEQLAEDLQNYVPIVYATQGMYAVAMRWKTQVNENAKMPAYYNMFSEMNHNEIVGFQNMPEMFSVIFLRNQDDNERIQKRFEICKSLIPNNIHEIWSKGESLLAKICYLVHFGDWFSYYLALIKERDPTPVDIIENLKKELVK